MRMAKAPQEHIDIYRRWMQFNDELSKIDPLYYREWEQFKKDWEDENDFIKIIEHCSDENGNFNYEYYWDYFQSHISHIYSRILFGFEVLLENVCDPELDYLDFKPEIKKAMEFYNNENNEQ